MTTLPSFLHDLPVEVHIAVWGVVVLPLAVGLFLAWLASAPGQRLRRALMAAGPALGIVGLLLVLPRLIQLLHPEFGGSPQRWLLSTARIVAPAQVPDLALHAYDTAAIEHLALSSAAMVVLPLAALLFRIWTPRVRGPLPLSVETAIACGLLASVLPFTAHHALVEPGVVIGLEFLAAAPVASLLLGMRVLAAWPPSADATHTHDRPDAPSPIPDVRGAWVRAEVLAADASPWLDLQTDAPSTTEAPSARATRAWAAAGAHGPPPGALDRLVDAAEPAVWLVGDLPPHAEQALVDAFLADRAGVGGARMLALVHDPEAAAERLAVALKRAHTWLPGALTAGASALEEALVRDRVPVVAFVAPEELASRVVPLVARGGRTWAESLRWMVMVQPQRGTPRQVTHTAFALRRWRLGVQTARLPAVLATGPDTPATRAFLESLFPGRPVRSCPWQARDRGAVTLWPADTRRHAPADPWSARASLAVAELGVDVVLHDPSLDHLTTPDERVQRRADPDVVGLASVAHLPATGLPLAWRQARNRLPDPAATMHHALWHVPTGPLGHFLTRPGRLASLHARGELPIPRPVAGTRNRFLRLAHLRAALEDGHADEIALRRTFGDDVVDFALAEVEPTGTHVARISADGAVVRAPVLRGPHGVDAPEPGREALTAQRVQLVEDATGTVLGEVDRQVVATRYHPKRVFSRNGRRFRVPLHALDAKRGQLRVRSADPRDGVTRPLLRVLVEPGEVVVDPVRRREGGLSVTTLTLAAVVVEEVVGAWVPGHDQVEHFDPVRSRYDTEVRLILPAGAQPGRALGHLASLVSELLPAHLALGADDAEAVVIGAGLQSGLGAGIAVVDRHVGGLGVARALDDGTVIDVLRWVRAILHACDCDTGCHRCTPEPVLRAGADKAGVLTLLPVE